MTDEWIDTPSLASALTATGPGDRVGSGGRWIPSVSEVVRPTSIHPAMAPVSAVYMAQARRAGKAGDWRSITALAQHCLPQPRVHALESCTEREREREKRERERERERERSITPIQPHKAERDYSYPARQGRYNIPGTIPEPGGAGEREGEREVLHLSSPKADSGAARTSPGRSQKMKQCASRQRRTSL